MNSAYRGVATLQIAFVIIFISLTLVLFFPLQQVFSEKMQELKHNILELLEDNLGSNISFSSIHPSILSYIEIRHLRIYDDADQTILTIDRLIFRYDIGLLLRGDILAAPRSIEVRGGSLFLDKLALNNDTPFGTNDLSLETAEGIETVLTNLSDDLTVNLHNYQLYLHDDNTEVELESRISRGKVVLKKQSLEFDLTNSSKFSRFSPQTESGMFEISGTSQLEGKVFLPAVLSIAEIRKNGILQLYISTKNMESNLFTIAPVDLYLAYKNGEFTLHSLEDTQAFAFELVYNTNSILVADASGSELASQPTLAVHFVASEWVPSSIVTFRNEYQPYHYLLNSIITTDIAMEFSDALVLTQTQLNIDAETWFPTVEQTASLNIQLDFEDQIFNLKRAQLRTRNGDNVRIQGWGDFLSNDVFFSGEIKNASLPSLPRLATDFTVQYQRKVADVRLFNSSLLDLPLGNTRALATFYTDSVDVDIIGQLASGNGEVRWSVVLSQLAGIIPGAVDIELTIDEVPFAEVVAAVASMLGISRLTLPDDLVNSQIQGTITAGIDINNDLFSENVPEGMRIRNNARSNNGLDELVFQVLDLQLIEGDVSIAKAFVDASYKNGIVEVPRIAVHYKDQQVETIGNGDLRDPRRFTLSFDTLVNSFPYSYEIVGLPQRGELVLTGDYQTNVNVSFRNGRGRGRLDFGHLPLPVFGEQAWLGGAIALVINTEDIATSSIDITRLGLHRAILFPAGMEGTFTIDASGALSRGISITELAYNDSISQLSGTGRVSLDDERENVAFETLLSNDLESYAVEANISLLDSSIGATLDLTNFTTRRLALKDITGVLNTSISLSQSPEMGLSLAFDLETVNTRLQSTDEALSVQMSGSLRDNILILTDGIVEVAVIAADNIAGSYNLANGILRAKADLLFANVSRNKNLSQLIELSLSAPGIKSIFTGGEDSDLSTYWHRADGKLILTSVDENAEATEVWNLTISEQEDNLLLNGGPGYAPDNIVAVIYENGEFGLELTDPLPVTFSAEGFFANNRIDMTVSNVQIDPGTIEFSPNIITIINGNIEGSGRIVGNILDPNFYGTFFVENLKGDIDVIPAPLLAPSGVVILEGQTIYFPPVRVEAGEGSAYLQGELAMNHWSPTSLYLSIDTKDSAVPITSDFNSIVVDGWGSGAIELSVDLLTEGLDMSGTIVASSTAITISDIEKRRRAASQNNPRPLAINLDIKTGKAVEFYWPTRDFPILRSTAVGGESIALDFSNTQNVFELAGDVALKGGEIFYFEQDFYIRQGNILFNENRDKKFDPLVSLSAEFRGSSRGSPIRIYLDVTEDTISQMQPRFSSDSIKSEEELIVLLGGKVGGSEEGNSIDLSNAIASGSQILGQLRALTDIENDIRQTLNLDLLSLRIGLLPNLLENAISTSPTASTTPVSLGAYLDNTTLRIGKYLGDDIFVEGSVQLQEQNPFNRPINDQLGLKVVPELRIDWETPIFTLTWAWTPFEHPKTLSVTDHRITFTKNFFLGE